MMSIVFEGDLLPYKFCLFYIGLIVSSVVISSAYISDGPTTKQQNDQVHTQW